MVKKPRDKSLLILSVILVLAVIALVSWIVYERLEDNKVNSFDECAEQAFKRGEIINDTNPRQCKTEDGKVFTDEAVRL